MNPRLVVTPRESIEISDKMLLAFSPGMIAKSPTGYGLRVSGMTVDALRDTIGGDVMLEIQVEAENARTD